MSNLVPASRPATRAGRPNLRRAHRPPDGPPTCAGASPPTLPTARTTRPHKTSTKAPHTPHHPVLIGNPATPSPEPRHPQPKPSPSPATQNPNPPAPPQRASFSPNPQRSHIRRYQNSNSQQNVIKQDTARHRTKAQTGPTHDKSNVCGPP